MRVEVNSIAGLNEHKLHVRVPSSISFPIKKTSIRALGNAGSLCRLVGSMPCFMEGMCRVPDTIHTVAASEDRKQSYYVMIARRFLGKHRVMDAALVPHLRGESYGSAPGYNPGGRRGHSDRSNSYVQNYGLSQGVWNLSLSQTAYVFIP